MEIKKVGVVGCGLMGRGIVEVSSKAGYDVIVSEINQELLDKGMAAIKTSFAKAVEKGRMTDADAKAALARIKGTTNTGDFKDRDIVVEAAVENMELKKKIFRELDSICPPETILASNTSCLSVIDIASVTKRQPKVMGVHFFNPVPVMKLVELVRTITTSDDTVAAAKVFCEKVGKTVVMAPDIPGFIVNRLMIPFLLEAIRLLETGLVTKEDMDTAVKLGLNHPMGPLQLSDFIGLDTGLFICDAMYNEFKDDRFAAPILLRKMVTAGQLGAKSGKGFYDYSKK
jgi:3-hydroxybutyryl-CoA dehydrogenase